MTVDSQNVQRQSMQSPHSARLLSRLLSWVLASIAVIGVICLLYATLVRPWLLRWGATDTEVKMGLPGDDLISNPAEVNTMAISINAPATKVWPWLLQIGYGRAGWYSYEGIEDALGAAKFVDGYTSNRIVPELQNLKVGDRIDIIGGIQGAPNLRVVKIEPNRSLVLAWTLGDNKPVIDNKQGQIWSFTLQADSNQTTRLLVRTIVASPPSLYNYLTDPEFYVMYHKMMVGIKERAERNQNFVTGSNQIQLGR